MWEELWGSMIWSGAPEVPLLSPIGMLVMGTCLIVGGLAFGGPSRRRWLAPGLIVTVLLVPLIAIGGSVTVPNTFSNGTIADANEVNANFQVLETEVNDNDARIDILETAPTLPTGQSCPAGESVTGFDVSGELVCSGPGGNEGDPCTDASDCGVTAPFCAPDGLCHDGSGSDPCSDESSCSPSTPFCGPAGCQAGADGDPCISPADCSPSAPYCTAVGSCSVVPCSDDFDCEASAPICGPSGCQAGVEGDACLDASNCGATAPICASSGMCQDGSAGDECIDASDCGASAPTCGTGGVCE